MGTITATMQPFMTIEWQGRGQLHMHMPLLEWMEEEEEDGVEEDVPETEDQWVENM